MKEQWQELKETIIEIRDNNKFNEDVSAICKFLINYMGVLEKQMQELCEYAPFTIDELEDEDMQKLLRGFKNQQVIVTDHDCSPSVTIIEPCGDVPDINVGDMISRQAVLSYIERILNQGTGKKKSFEYIQKYVEKLPPVNSTKTGWNIAHGMYEDRFWCSCGFAKVMDSSMREWKYCPVCGKTKMEESEE
jgi:hypothetical protein